MDTFFFDYQFYNEDQSERYYPPTQLTFNSSQLSANSSDGRFQFLNIKNGNYDLKVSAAGFEEINEKVVINDSHVNLEFDLTPLHYEDMFPFSVNSKWKYTFSELTKSDIYPRIERKGEMVIEIIAANNFDDGTHFEFNETLTYTNIAYSGLSEDAHKDTTYYESDDAFFANVDLNQVVHFDAKGTIFNGFLNSIVQHDFNKKIPSYFVENEEFNINRYGSTMTLKSNTGLVSFVDSNPQNQYLLELNLISYEKN